MNFWTKYGLLEQCVYVQYIAHKKVKSEKPHLKKSSLYYYSIFTPPLVKLNHFCCCFTTFDFQSEVHQNPSAEREIIWCKTSEAAAASFRNSKMRYFYSDITGPKTELWNRNETEIRRIFINLYLITLSNGWVYSRFLYSKSTSIIWQKVSK